MKVEAEFEEAAYNKKQGVYHELPLYELKEKYTSEAGKAFLQKIVDSQPGKPHPQFKNDPEARIYKVFMRNEIKDGFSTSAKSKISAGGQQTLKYILTYIHTFMHAYMHTNMHTPAVDIFGMFCGPKYLHSSCVWMSRVELYYNKKAHGKSQVKTFC